MGRDQSLIVMLGRRFARDYTRNMRLDPASTSATLGAGSDFVDSIAVRIAAFAICSARIVGSRTVFRAAAKFHYFTTT